MRISSCLESSTAHCMTIAHILEMILSGELSEAHSYPRQNDQEGFDGKCGVLTNRSIFSKDNAKIFGVHALVYILFEIWSVCLHKISPDSNLSATRSITNTAPFSTAYRALKPAGFAWPREELPQIAD